MKEMVAEILRQGLHGKHTHVSPEKALLGLNSDNSKLVPNEELYSCLEILYHMVFWQDITIDAIEGKDIDWASTHGKDWPTEEMLLESTFWDNTFTRFNEGLARIETILSEVDLETPIPTWNDAPVATAILVLAQHNSYHIGQIVMNRKALKMWPPPEEKDS